MRNVLRHRESKYVTEITMSTQERAYNCVSQKTQSWIAVPNQTFHDRLGKMCLAIPGKILECQNIGGTRQGRVQFGGIVRLVSLDFVPEAVVDDYVMVHVGFAISRIAAEEAERTYKLLEEMGALEEELATETESGTGNAIR